MEISLIGRKSNLQQINHEFVSLSGAGISVKICLLFRQSPTEIVDRVEYKQKTIFKQSLNRRLKGEGGTQGFILGGKPPGGFKPLPFNVLTFTFYGPLSYT